MVCYRGNEHNRESLARNTDRSTECEMMIGPQHTIIALHADGRRKRPNQADYQCVEWESVATDGAWESGIVGSLLSEHDSELPIPQAHRTRAPIKSNSSGGPKTRTPLFRANHTRSHRTRPCDWPELFIPRSSCRVTLVSNLLGLGLLLLL